MKITIQGQDFTSALDQAHPLTVKRTLNEPSVCELWVSLPANSTLVAPVRNQQITVEGDNGTVYFTGYIAATPMPEYAGISLTGPMYRLAIQAVSDELLLDQILMPPSKGTSELTAAQLIENLVLHTGSTSLSTSGISLSLPVSHFAPDANTNFSTRAGQVATQVRAAYRAQAGQITLEPVPGAVHTLNETDGSLTLANLTLTAAVKRALANDITVCGLEEPIAYVTEYFLGDGTTTTFYLTYDPFALPTSKEKIIIELFNETQINSTVWANTGGSTYLSLGASGLSMTGGAGVDGAVQLNWIDQIEMGGMLLLEANGVTLANGSAGILAGFFSGSETEGGCFAGFQATAASGTGAVSLQPMVSGTAVGTSYAVNPANQYTLRVRVHCPDTIRAQATYYSFGDAGAISAGGATSMAPANLLFELVEVVDGVASMPVVLYDGAVANAPASCMVTAVSSITMEGTLRSIYLTNLGSGWVVTTPSGGAAYTRRVGPSTQGAECEVERTGKLLFYTGYVPPAGEQIAVSYRSELRAVGRAVNTASQAELTANGLPPVSAWIGSVTNPPARCSADCRNAASVMTQASGGVSALWAGTYKGTQLSFATDVWPGDALALNAPSTNLDAQVVVRTVELTYTASDPDVVSYKIAFANDWADDLAIKTSSTVPATTILPALVSPTYAQDLNTLTVTSLTGSAVTVNTGMVPPAGGGFEVRTRDFAFMPGEDPTLVMRAATETLTFARISANDRFFIRMYDGATPPNYSEHSTALFINLPLSS